MTISEHSHRAFDIHITGSDLAGYFAVFDWNERRWVTGSDPDNALKNACKKIDQLLLEYTDN